MPLGCKHQEPIPPPTPADVPLLPVSLSSPALWPCHCCVSPSLLQPHPRLHSLFLHFLLSSRTLSALHHVCSRSSKLLFPLGSLFPLFTPCLFPIHHLLLKVSLYLAQSCPSSQHYHLILPHPCQIIFPDHPLGPGGLRISLPALCPTEWAQLL